MASPSRTPWCDLLEHLDLREADRVHGSSALSDDVRDGEARDNDQQPEPARCEEVPAHRWTIAGRNRRRRTWAAIWDSQSPSVVSSNQSLPDARTVCSRCSRCSAARSAKRRCTLPVTITSRVAPGRGIGERHETDRRHVELAWVDDADREEIVTHRQRRHRRRPLRPGKVGDHADEATTLAQGTDAAEGLGKIAAAEPFGVGRIGHRSEDGSNIVASESRWRDAQVGPRDQHRPESVLVARGQEADGGGSGKRDLRLRRVLRSEVHRRGEVDDHPRLEVAIRDLVAHVQLAGSGGDVPVDATNIVARLVRTRFAGLTSVARGDALVLTVQLSVEATVDGELQRPQHLRNRCRSRPARPFDRRARGHLSSARWRRSASARPTSSARC